LRSISATRLANVLLRDESLRFALFNLLKNQKAHPVLVNIANIGQNSRILLMRIILLQNIKGLGQIGDVKSVSDGYAKNFLLPRKMIKLATNETLKEVESLKKKLASMQEIEKRDAQQAVEKLKDLVIELSKKATKTGKLFAGIDSEDLVKAVKKTSGIDLKEEMIGYEGPIKHIGEHFIDINILPDIKTQIKVVVKAE